jgi:hypothetical protein
MANTFIDGMDPFVGKYKQSEIDRWNSEPDQAKFANDPAYNAWLNDSTYWNKALTGFDAASIASQITSSPGFTVASNTEYGKPVNFGGWDPYGGFKSNNETNYFNTNKAIVTGAPQDLIDQAKAANGQPVAFGQGGVGDSTGYVWKDGALHQTQYVHNSGTGLAGALPFIAAMVVPGLGAALGSALAEAGIVTSAAEAAAAATAAGATAAEVSAAATAATATATQIGSAIASTAVQVAQGVPIDKAIMNAAISNVVQTGSTDVAKTIVDAGKDPAVANAIASVGGSIAKTAASGGSGTDILNNAVGALAGSGVTSLTAEELGTAASRAVGAAVGTAAAGGDTAKVLGAAAGSLGNTTSSGVPVDSNTPLDAQALSELTPEERTAYNAGGMQGLRDFTTQQRTAATTDTSTGTSSVAAPGTQEVVITAPAGGAANVPTGDQQILNLIANRIPVPGGVISPAAITAPGADVGPPVPPGLGAGANVASTTATTETPAAKEEVVVTAEKPVVSDANVSPTIVDTSSKSLIDTTTSLANAAGQEADTVTVTADKPASNVSTGDQQIIDLISGDTSKTADTGTAVTDAGTVNVTAGRENVAAPTIIDVVAPPTPAPAPAPAPVDKTEEVVVTAKKDNVAPTIIDTVTKPAVSKTETAPAEKTAPAEEEVAKETVPYKPELFIFGGTAPKGRKSSTLSQTINAPFYPSTGLTQALTASRPAGEIEADPSGKKRQNVWNEASLRLKDALGL